MELDIYIKQILVMYKSSIKMRMLFAFLIILLGVAIILLNVFNIIPLPKESEESKKIISIGGTLISSICTLPIKEIVDRKNKIKFIKILTDSFNKSSGKDKKKIEELLWKLIEKNTVN